MSRLNTRVLIVILVICVLALLTPVAFYFYQFWNSDLSNDPAQWGQAGDFVGGMLNPMIALIHLGVTFYIATEVHKLTQEQGDKQNEINRKVVTRQLQFQVLTEYKKEFQVEIDKMRLDRSSLIRSMKDLEMSINSFQTGPGQLFKCAGMLSKVSEAAKSIYLEALENNHESIITIPGLNLLADLFKAQNNFLTEAYAEISDQRRPG